MLGLFGLVIAVEGLVSGRNDALTRGDYLNWRYAKQQAASQGPRNEILCLGSSLVKMGVASRVIETETGRRTFNLATSNGCMPVSYFLLRRAVEAGARPTAVLVDCPQVPIEHPESYKQGLELENRWRYWPELLSVRDTLDLAYVSRDAHFLTTTLVSRLIPSYKVRFEARRFVLTSLRGEGESSSWESQFLRRNWRANRGTQILHPNPESEVKDRGVIVKTPPRPTLPSWGVNRLEVIYARRFLDLATAHKIRVFWLIPPVSESQQELDNSSGKDDHHTRFVEQIHDYKDDVEVLDGRRSGYPAEAFWDTIHMNVIGAKVFSLEVASAVRRHLAGSSPHRLWTVIPPYRDPAGVLSPPLETILESGAILKQAGDAERLPLRR